jgi:dTDP-4-dehydrorhamnose 3,5-epimerase
MPVVQTGFRDLVIFEPVLHADSRGYFFESYNKNTLQALGIQVNFVQDNQARSEYGVLRGLHYQLKPHPQTKLIRVLDGTILDVAVDLRKGSPTYGKAFTLELSAQNKKQLLVPRGFAHGYSVLSPIAEVFYKCDEFYHKEHEGGIDFSDPFLNIDWKVASEDAIISDKDRTHPTFEMCRNNFVY